MRAKLGHDAGEKKGGESSANKRMEKAVWRVSEIEKADEQGFDVYDDIRNDKGRKIEITQCDYPDQ